jgi:hypothetical protein
MFRLPSAAWLGVHVKDVAKLEVPAMCGRYRVSVDGADVIENLPTKPLSCGFSKRLEGAPIGFLDGFPRGTMVPDRGGA